MDGSTKWPTRRFIQAGFNRQTGFPRVLLAQSLVGREGLNLHRACRVVVQFHPEWNPGVQEQQIGRVDRHGSLWTQKASQWLEDEGRDESTVPLIEVRQVIFGGTYDEHQWRTLYGRKSEFDASLFSALLSTEAMEKVPPELRESVLKGAPNFAPYEYKDLVDS